MMQSLCEMTSQKRYPEFRYIKINEFQEKVQLEFTGGGWRSRQLGFDVSRVEGVSLYLCS